MQNKEIKKCRTVKSEKNIRLPVVVQNIEQPK